MTPERRSELIALLVLTGIILLVMGTPVVLGRSWLPMPMPESAFSSEPSGYERAHTVRPYGADSFTFPHFEWPARVVARNAEGMGEFALWNPYAGLGFPLLGQYETQLLFPFEIFERAMGLDGWQFFVVLRVLLGAVGAYVFASVVSRSAGGKCVGALVYAFSAYFVWLFSIPPFTTCAMLIPWMFWAGARLVSNRGHAWLWATLLGLMAGLLLLAGQPQITALAIGACAVFMVLRLLLERPPPVTRVLRMLLLSSAAGMLALLISAPQTLPFLEAERWGYSLHTPGAYFGGHTPPLNLSIPLWPYLLGQPMLPWRPDLFPARLNWEAFPFLVGASGLLLGALGAVMLCRHYGDSSEASVNGRALLALLAGLLAIPLLGSAGYAVWAFDPVTRINFPRYITPVLALCLGAVMAYGVDRLSQARAGDLWWAFGLSLTLVAGCYALVHPILMTALAGLTPDLQYFHHSLVLGFAPFAAVGLTLAILLTACITGNRDAGTTRVAIALVVFAEFAYFIRYGFSTAHELWRVAVVVAFCAAALAFRQHPRVSVAALAIMGFAPAVLFATAERSMPYRFDPSSRPSTLTLAIKRELGHNSTQGRLLAGRHIWTPNFGNVYGIAQLDSLAPIQIKSTADLIFNVLTENRVRAPYTTPNAWLGLGDAVHSPSWKDYRARRIYYNLLAVRVLVDRVGGSLAAEPLEGVAPIWTDGVHIIYRDTHARARAYLVEASPPGAELLAKPHIDVVSNLFDLADRPLIEGHTHVRSITPSSLLVDVSAQRPALLVVADAYFPGWTVQVDGRDRRLVRVGGALRGVFVQPGDRSVEFRYRPTYFKELLTLSVCALIAALLALVAWSVRPWPVSASRQARTH